MKEEDTKITSRQLAAFWRTFGIACSEQGIVDKAKQNEYRHRVLIEEAGAESIKELDRTKGYERVMFRLNIDAGRYEYAARYESAEERRFAYMIERCVNQILQLASSESHSAERYVCGILYHAKINYSKTDDTYWLDLSYTNLCKLFQMLDTHRRRLISRYKGSVPLTFNPKAFYHIDRSGELFVDYQLALPNAFKLKQ